MASIMFMFNKFLLKKKERKDTSVGQIQRFQRPTVSISKWSFNKNDVNELIEE